MGMFDNSSFQAPDFNSGNDSSQQLGDFLRYKDYHERKQMDFQKELLNFQSNLRLQELGKQLAMQKAHEAPPAMPNAIYRPEITPYQQGTLVNNADKNKITKENNEDKNKIAQENADTKKDIADDPNYAQMRTAGGQVYYIDKKSGHIVDTGVAQGTLTGSQQFANKQSLQQEAEGAREHLEGTRQGNRVTNLNIRGNQATSNIAAKGTQDRLTRSQFNPNGAANLPSQQLIREKTAANDFINKNPALGKYVTIDPNTGMVHVAQPSTGSSLFSFGNSGPSPEEYHQILNALYGERTSVSDKPASDTTQQPTDIYITKDGKKFKLNNPAQLQDALKQGYTQVK
jgi:hypothetical protein